MKNTPLCNMPISISTHIYTCIHTCTYMYTYVHTSTFTYIVTQFWGNIQNIISFLESEKYLFLNEKHIKNKILAGQARVSTEVGKCTVPFVSAHLLKVWHQWFGLCLKAPEPQMHVWVLGLLLSDHDQGVRFSLGKFQKQELVHPTLSK